MDTLLQNIRYAFRTFGKNRSFSTIAIVMLAIGIGATTAIFSVVHAVLLRPLPFKDPDRLVMVFERKYNAENKKNVVNPANFLAWRDRAKSFESLSAMTSMQRSITGAGDPEQVPVAIVTHDLPETAGVLPKLGRSFNKQDAAEGAPDVALISEGFWRRKFGSDPSAVGRALNVDGAVTTIVGVMPANFDLPDKVDVWLPWTITAGLRQSRGRHLLTLARLRPGVTLQQANAEMDAIAANLEKERPDFDSGWGTFVVPLREQIVGDVRPALLMLLGAVSAVMLIVCVNVANLLLIRGTARTREIAVRMALGVGRGRLVSQLLTESVVLAIVGGVAGIFLAQLALNALLALVPTSLPQFSPIAIDVRVLGFALALSALTGVLFGLAPALQAIRMNVNDSLKSTSGSIAHASGRGVRNAFVIAEAALALMLLVGAGLLMRSFVRLIKVDPGFRAQNVLTVQVSLSRSRYNKQDKIVAFHEQAMERLAALPQVDSVGAISYLPLAGPGSATGFSTAEHPIANIAEQPVADIRSVGGEYFKAMGIQFVQGRSFGPEDRAADKIKKVVVNETLARQIWPNQNPVGKLIKMEWGPILDAEVIGVVRDVAMAKLETEPQAALYWYLPQFPYSGITYVMHTRTEPTSVASSARVAVGSVDREQPVGKIESMEDVLADSVKAARFNMTLLVIFAVTALLLSSVGLYGVVSYMVAQRTQEIGVRMAFGATRGNIARLVISQGMALICVGIVIGIGGGLVLSRFLQSMLFQVSANDAFTFAAVTAVLATVALAACYVPAYRAMHVEPVSALRNE